MKPQTAQTLAVAIGVTLWGIGLIAFVIVLSGA